MTYFRKFFLYFFVSCFYLSSFGEPREAQSPQTDILDELIERLKNFTFNGFETGTYSSNCRIDIQNSFKSPQPLLLYPGSTKIYEPQPNGELVIPHNGLIEFNCQRELLDPFNQKQKIVARCIGRNQFKVGWKTYEISDFVCSSWFSSVARKTGKKCFNNMAAEIEVGFQLTSDQRFVRTYDVCHDDEKGSTLYVHHRLTPASNSHQSGVKRTSFRKGNFYGNLNVDHLYKQKTQKETVGRILGGNHEKYFDESSALFLARGHLSAKADHIYANEQRATFYFINAAPQWQIFNAGNWQTIEDDVRRHAQLKKLYLECYTGTWGVGTLPDGNGDHKELHLHFDGNANGIIPVPKLYYRIVIDTKTRAGIVLIGVNNPHLTMDEIESDYIICKDVGDQIKWIAWKKDSIKLGYSYACEVNDFLKTVKHVKNLDVRGLLI